MSLVNCRGLDRGTARELIAGRLTLRGVTREVTATAEARWNGETIDLAARAPVKRATWNVDTSSLAGFSVSRRSAWNGEPPPMADVTSFFSRPPIMLRTKMCCLRRSTRPGEFWRHSCRATRIARRMRSSFSDAKEWSSASRALRNAAGFPPARDTKAAATAVSGAPALPPSMARIAGTSRAGADSG